MSTSISELELSMAQIKALTKGHQFFPYTYNHEDLQDEVGRLTEASKKIHRIHESRFEEREDGHWEYEIDGALRREHWVAVSLYEDIEIDVMRALKRMRKLEKVLLNMPENPHAVQRCDAVAIEDEDEEWTIIAKKQNNHVHWADTDITFARIEQEKLAQRRLLQFMAFILALVLLKGLIVFKTDYQPGMGLQGENPTCYVHC